MNVYAPAYYYNPISMAGPIIRGRRQWCTGGAGEEVPGMDTMAPTCAPYPVYPSAAFWLTDYLVSASLQAAYAEQ